METEVKAYQERKSRNKRIALKFFGFWTIYFIIVSFLPGSFAFIIFGFFGFYLSGIFVSSRYIISESIEERVFYRLYKTLDLLELYPKEKESLKFIKEEAAKHLKSVIFMLRRFYEGSHPSSTLYSKEFASLFRDLNEKLERRILPRIINYKDIERVKSAIKELAEFFGEIHNPMSSDKLRDISKGLEIFEEIVIEKKTVKSIMKSILSSKPAKLIGSLFLGYFSVVMIILIFCQATNIDFMGFMRGNLMGIVSAGAVISGIYAGILVLKR
jgi:hypothetical protein